MLVQIVRFTLPSSLTISAAAFKRLRQDVAASGASAQYFGYSVPVRGAPVSKKRHEISWLIQWPGEALLAGRRSLLDDLRSISQEDATYVQITFTEEQHETLLTAIQAPLCEIVVLRTKEDAPVTDEAFSKSMHKTYTDCYKTLGFVGGDWGYSINTNDVQGESIDHRGARQALGKEKQRLGIYLLGWESSELHEDYNASPLFAEEMGKLGPWVDKSTGAWYVSFQKHEQ